MKNKLLIIVAFVAINYGLFTGFKAPADNTLDLLLSSLLVTANLVLLTHLMIKIYKN